MSFPMTMSWVRPRHNGHAAAAVAFAARFAP
jgi:hypothetical protein